MTHRSIEEKIGKLLPEYHFSKDKLSYYSLIWVLVDQKEKPLLVTLTDDVEGYLIFTESSLIERYKSPQTLETLSQVNKAHSFKEYPELRSMMLGHLVSIVKDQKSFKNIFVNPVKVQKEHFYEKLVLSPIYDPTTQKDLLSDPSDATALFAISPEDQKRYGIEVVYYLITNRTLSEDSEQRQTELKEKIDELSFCLPKVPIKKGSGTFVAIILNLDNVLEERAFIREYKTFDAQDR